MHALLKEVLDLADTDAEYRDVVVACTKQGHDEVFLEQYKHVVRGLVRQSRVADLSRASRCWLMLNLPTSNDGVPEALRMDVIEFLTSEFRGLKGNLWTNIGKQTNKITGGAADARVHTEWERMQAEVEKSGLFSKFWRPKRNKSGTKE